MSLTMVSPESALYQSQTIQIAFSGRFGFGIDQWAYLPFEVPPGVRRIRVSTSHDNFAVRGVIRNVLDLGIFGPAGHDLGNAAGFRGWSGGARDGFEISETDATPGYLAGPIEPGVWAVALGPVVLCPWGMGWQAQVTLELGPSGAEAGRVESRPVASGPVKTRPAETRPVESASVESARATYPPPPVLGAGWYRGDLHLHTVHSDGQRDPAGLVAAAHSSALDFVVSTDHNTNSANRVFPTCRTGPLLVVPGEEVTTRHGHWLAVGLAPGGWVDWRYAPRDGVFARFAAEVRESGGLVVAAHPSVPVPGSRWEFGFDHVDALEVWNGRWNIDDEVSLRIWQRQLCAGRRISAVSGSDSHSHSQPVGLPQTVVYARELSVPALVDGLRTGRSYIARSRSVIVEFTVSVSSSDEVAGPGQTLRAPPNTLVTVTAMITGAAHTNVALITAAGCVGRATVTGSARTMLRCQLDAASARFARLEIRDARRRPLGAMVALTNPVWLAG